MEILITFIFLFVIKRTFDEWLDDIKSEVEQKNWYN